MRIRISKIFSVCAALTIVLTGCGDDATGTSGTGSVEGSVLIDGIPMPGMTVQLAGLTQQSIVTDEEGRYVFGEVPAGAYVLTVLDTPADASFPSTAKAAVVADGRTERVDFVGSYIRTSSIAGLVTVRGQGTAGVRAVLSGVESDTMRTNAEGQFAFNGLRAGSYRVEISDLPEGVTFTSVATDVELGTGDSHLTTFQGERDLTASVLIQSIRAIREDGTTAPADPKNLFGMIEVTVVVDRGEDTAERVEILLGEEIVATQSFNLEPTPSDAEAVEPASASPAEISFTVNTASFDLGTGSPDFMNGERLLSARLATLEGGSSAWVSSVPVGLWNSDTFHGSMTATQGPFTGEDGEDWVGGSVTVSLVPVIYHEGREVEGVSVELRRVGGGSLAEKDASEDTPFSVVFSDAPGGALYGYKTPVGSVDQLRVRRATLTDGSTMSGLPVVLVEEVRIDNDG